MGRNQRDENLQVDTPVQTTSGGSVTVTNGSANVTISNVAPAGVGTATISRWLVWTIDDIAYYIPMWT